MLAKMINRIISEEIEKMTDDIINNTEPEDTENDMENMNDEAQSTGLNVLIACEESQTVCAEFRKLGHNAYSCDLQNCSGGHPEWHFNMDALAVINDKGGMLETGEEYHLPEGEQWDLLIAHPPCTFLAVSGARWMYHPDDKELPVDQRRPHPKHPNRRQQQDEGADFFMKFINSPVEHVAVENPVGVMSTRFRKPDQIVQPYMFGDEATKTTCLWLKNLPPLTPTNIVGKGERHVYADGKKSDPQWIYDAWRSKDRQKIRSKTFPGIAKAMAEQWSAFLS